MPLPQTRVAEIPLEIRAFFQRLAVGVAQDAGGEEVGSHRLDLGLVDGADDAALAAQEVAVDQHLQRSVDQRRIGQGVLVGRYQQVAGFLRVVDGELIPAQRCLDEGRSRLRVR